jgi:hypothetical protein
MRYVVLAVLKLLLMTGITAMVVDSHAGQIHLKQGYSVPAERWWEENGMVFYEITNETRAVSKADVLRIEKVEAKDPYLTVIKGACREPQIGDPLPTTQEFFKCLAKDVKMRKMKRRNLEILVYRVAQDNLPPDWYAFVNDRLWQIETSRTEFEPKEPK